MADESDIRAEAKRHFEAGLTLTKMEKFEDAAHEFEASISLHPTASALFNLANCYKVSHHYDDALSAFSKMRIDYKEELSPEIHRAIERHVKEILSLVAEIHIAVTPHGATIRLDGRIIGTSPLDKNVRVDPGKRQVQVSLDGYQTEHREIDLLAKETSSLSFDLKRSRAKLFISSNVDDATVFVDGQEVGYTPLSDPLLLEPGNYAVRLDKTGYAAGERDVDLTAENQRFLNLILMPTASGVESKPALSLWSWLGVGLTVAT
ncbi:MAG: PEGA domain-containing protein, partial [Proteobacteria bacterium]|nr:PEGA domain-containing protein [Pseudomonadota bacterium]